MRELAGDVLTVIGPAALAYWAFGDPLLAGLWAVVGLTIRWYRRRWNKPPYKDEENSGRRPE
jgi:hypothetical protein